MIVNNKDIKIDDVVEYVNIDKNIPKKRKNGLVLRDSWIDVLNRYNINYMNYSSIKDLLFIIEDILNEDSDLEDLEELSYELSEFNYYNYTNK